MKPKDRESLLVIFNSPLPPASAVREILKNRPEPARLACGPYLTARYVEDCGLGDARIIPLEGGWKSLARQLRGIRRDRPGTALAVGGATDLSAPLLAAGSRARRKQACLVAPSGTRTVRIRPAVLAARIGWRLLLFLYALPAILLLRALPGRRGRGSRTGPDPLPPPAEGETPPAASLVVPNFNGRDLLAVCLPSLERALSAYPGGGEIIVVDDGSSDGSVEWIRINHPAVRLIALPENQGFGRASNLGVAAARHRLAVLLNSDISVEPDFLSPLLRHLTDPEIFAVQPRMETWTGGGLDLGVNVGHMENGYIRIWNEREDAKPADLDFTSPNLYAVGGAMAFDREKWNLLGGLDEIYYPFCWEDIDLSYRAGKRGWQVLYEPASRLRHIHYATISRFFTPGYKRTIERQNELLFIWKNIHSPRLWKDHLNNLPRLLLAGLFRGNLAFYRGFWKAFFKIGTVAVKRSRELARSRVSDENLFRRSLLPYRDWLKRGCRPRGENDRPGLLIITSNVPYPPNDGGKIRLYQMLKNLSNRYDIHFISFYRDDNELNRMKGIEPFCRSAEGVLFNPRPMALLPRTITPQYCQHWIDRAMEEKIREVLKSRPIDIVQIDSSLMAYYARAIADLPIIFVELDAGILRPGQSYNPSERGWKKPLEFYEWMRMLRFELKLLPHFTRVVTLNRDDEKLLKSYLPDLQVSTVTMGTDLDHFLEPYIDPGNKRIIFVGSMGHYPNLDAISWFVRKIFPEVRAEVPETVLMIVGSGDGAQVGDIRHRPGVEFIGEVDDVRPFLRRATVFVSPVRRGSGMKGKVLEALAMAKPMVATPVAAGGIPVVSGEHLLLAEDSHHFAGEVIRLLNDPDLRETLARNGQRLVRESFGWQLKADEMDRIYREILGEVYPPLLPVGRK